MTALLWLRRDLRVHDHPALEAAAPAPTRSCRCSASTTGCSTAAMPRARARSSCSSAWPTSTPRCAGAAAGWSSATGDPRSVLPALARETRRHARSTSAPTSARSPAPATPASSALLDRVPSTSTRGRSSPTISTTSARPPASPYTVFTPFYRTWTALAATRQARRPAEAPAAPERPRPRAPPVASPISAYTGDRGSALPWRRDRRAHGDARRLGAALALPPLRLHLAARARGPRQRHRGQTAAVLARLLRPRAAPPSPERALGAPGPVPGHDPLEPSAQTVRGVVRGTHRLSDGRRRHAPAEARGLHGQPGAPRRRLVPDQGPRDRLALGRAVVHAPAARRRRGQQQRQLAVDRVGRRRPAAGVAPDPQPGPAAGQARPGRQLRPQVRPRAQQVRRATTRSRSSTTRRRAAKRSPATARPSSAGRDLHDESAGPEAICASGPEQHLPQVSEIGYPTSADIAPDWISSTVVAMSTSR